jgi:hypothetical protein
LVQVTVEEDPALQVRRKTGVVRLQKRYHIQLVLRFPTVLEYLLDEEVEDSRRGVVLLYLQNLLLGQRYQIVQGVLVPFKPHRLGHLLHTVLVVNRTDLLNMHVLRPLLRRYRLTNTQIQRRVLPLRQVHPTVGQNLRHRLQKFNQPRLALHYQVLQQLVV